MRELSIFCNECSDSGQPPNMRLVTLSALSSKTNQRTSEAQVKRFRGGLSIHSYAKLVPIHTVPNQTRGALRSSRWQDTQEALRSRVQNRLPSRLSVFQVTNLACTMTLVEDSRKPEG